VPKYKNALAIAITSANLCACNIKDIGRFKGKGGQRIVAVSVPEASQPTLERAAEDQAKQAIAEGEHLRVLLGTGPAAAARSVAFSVLAGGGNLHPTGNNSIAWEESQKALLDAVRSDIRKAFDALEAPDRIE
jgi:hypothetical protein